MTILEELERRARDLSGESAAFASSLVELSRCLTPQAVAHLKQVIAQQPEFDIHDRDHSTNVERNICLLLGEEGLAGRSAVELFLLNASAYLHDCAMALPQWELNVLELVDRRSFEKMIPAVCATDEAIQIIRLESAEIFGGQPISQEWLFHQGSNDELMADLGNRLRAYQGYRNGYAIDLQASAADATGYKKRTKALRQEFIRQTHFSRIEDWVRNLGRLLVDRLGGAWAKGLANDLATVCRSHGEGPEFVRALPVCVGYWKGERGNLQLVSLLLRLGDVCDFSEERAPEMLFQEKLIESPISRDHWEVKNEGISYAIEAAAGKTRVVRYSAFFQRPRLYYMFQGYLDLVDAELLLYSQILYSQANRPEWTALSRVADKVDRGDVRHDKLCFEPVPGMRFTLDQRRILELLMGVKLYKEPSACIRELYQNAADAVQCRMAAYPAGARGMIEFGLSSDEDGRYLYCQDNGVGMTREIVSRHLLKVGSSYYRSSDFQRLSSSWGHGFTPVSQFGVGILSCFMIGKRLEIVTKPLAEVYDSVEPIRFVIDGPHEQFYYTPVRTQDRERIGSSGTLVKLYLTDGPTRKWHNAAMENIAFWWHAAREMRLYAPWQAELQRWESHLLDIVSDFVGEYPEHAMVQVCCDDGTLVPVTRATTVFDHRVLGIPHTLVEVWDRERQQFGNRARKYLEILDEVRFVRLETEYRAAVFTTVIGLPKRGGAFTDYRDLGSGGFVRERNGLLINGIRMGVRQSMKEDIDALMGSGYLNFCGSERPQLSVDRTSVVEWPESLVAIAAQLHEQLAELIVREVCLHIAKEGLASDSQEVRLLWDYLFSRFSYLNGKLITRIIAIPEANFAHEELSRLSGRTATIAGIASASEIVIDWPRYASISEVSQNLLLGKLHSAEHIRIEDGRVFARSSTFVGLWQDDEWRGISNWRYVVRADEWMGEFQQYDLVGKLWPVIPGRLFDHLQEADHVSPPSARMRILHHYTNSLTAIAELDPLLIHPKQGIYRTKHQSFYGTEPASRVYRFEEISNDFWLLELHRHSSDRKERLVMTAFISPRILTKREVTDLEPLLASDPEYVHGAHVGWSVLILGQKEDNVVCLPGRVDRRELVARISAAFWLSHADKTFRFLDGELMEPYSGA